MCKIEMKHICDIKIDSACPSKVIGVQDTTMRHRMKDTEQQWMASVRDQYKGEIIQGQYRIEIDFHREEWKGNSPDIDNLIKTAFDAIKNHVIGDDRNIVEVEAKKMSGKNETLIHVYTV